MARGDDGKSVFEEDKDRFEVLDRLGNVCGNPGWRILGRVLIGNHFYLLAGCLEPNLITRLKTLLGGFSNSRSHLPQDSEVKCSWMTKIRSVPGAS